MPPLRPLPEARRRNQRRLGLARPRSSRCIVLFPIAAFRSAGLGRSRRPDAGPLRLRRGFGFRRLGGAEGSSARRSDTRAGGPPRRWGYRRRISGRHRRSAHSPVRSLDRAQRGLQRLSVRRPRLRIVNIPPISGETVTAELISEHARATGVEVSSIKATGRAAVSIAAALDTSACDVLVTIGGSGVGRTDATIAALAGRGEVIAHGIALRPGRTTAVGRMEKIPVIALPRRAGSGTRGVVDASASGAGSVVRPLAASEAYPAASTQDCLKRRHR